MLADSNDNAGGASRRVTSSELLGQKAKRMTFDLDAERHLRLKKVSVVSQRYIRDILIEALDEWLEKHDPQHEPK